MREAVRARSELERLVRSVMVAKDADSPVYQWLPLLQRPTMSEEEVEAMVDDTKAHERRLSAFVKSGKEASSASRHREAAEGVRQSARA